MRRKEERNKIFLQHTSLWRGNQACCVCCWVCLKWNLSQSPNLRLDGQGNQKKRRGRRGGARRKLHWEDALAFLRKFRMSGAYSESQSGSFQNNWLENNVSKNLSPFPLLPPSDSSGRTQGSHTVSWRWRERTLQSLSPLIMWSLPRPVPTQVTALQSALSGQRSSGSRMKTAWTTATLPQTPASSCFSPSVLLEWNT